MSFHHSYDITAPSLGQAETCEPILRALPEWFGIETAIQKYVEQIEKLPTVIATFEDKTVGFVTIKRHFPHAAEIYCMGVYPQYHRSGAGQALVRRVIQDLKMRDVRFLQVKTLSPSHPSEHYARTRAFYLRMGFEPFEEFPDLWGPHNPCLMMLMDIGKKGLLGEIFG